MDVGFWKNKKVLPLNSPLDRLLTADAATLKISNQKNGRMGQTIHLESIDKEYSPVQALARQVFHILDNNGTDTSPLCQYVTEDTIQN
eukprot:15175466-Ditylum_brightwellii.AAC.1